VQWGQRTALIGMAVKQKGQSLVVGTAATGAGLRRMALIHLTMMKMARETMMNSKSVFRKAP
jgi:hypothetical protein